MSAAVSNAIRWFEVLQLRSKSSSWQQRTRAFTRPDAQTHHFFFRINILSSPALLLLLLYSIFLEFQTFRTFWAFHETQINCHCHRHHRHCHRHRRQQRSLFKSWAVTCSAITPHSFRQSGRVKNWFFLVSFLALLLLFLLYRKPSSFPVHNLNFELTHIFPLRYTRSFGTLHFIYDLSQ